MKDIKPYNKKNKRHGYWEIYHYDGNLEYKGNYINGKPIGYFEVYHRNKSLLYKRFYI